MKCGQLNISDLAQAYSNAAEDAKGAEVDMATLTPHLAATGSSCGTCPALLTLAKKAFETAQDNRPTAPAPLETTLDVVRDSIFEVVPDLRRFIPNGG